MTSGQEYRDQFQYTDEYLISSFLVVIWPWFGFLGDGFLAFLYLFDGILVYWQRKTFAPINTSGSWSITTVAVFLRNQFRVFGDGRFLWNTPVLEYQDIFSCMTFLVWLVGTNLTGITYCFLCFTSKAPKYEQWERSLWVKNSLPKTS